MKICGCTTVRDAELAIDCGVDAIGVIFAGATPRAVSLEQGREIALAIPAFVTLVGVFVDPPAADVERARAMGFTPQFSGNEAPELCEAGGGPYIKVQHVAPETALAAVADFARVARLFRHAMWMFDTAVDGKRGGTGRTFDWAIARAVAAERHVIISGGLTPENVGSCIRRVRPYGVDVRSGVETGGVKDRNKLRAFVRAVKEADEQA